MKILHVCQYFFPWLGYQEYYLAREQIRDGHDIRIICSNLRWPVRGVYSALRDGKGREMPIGDGVEHGIPVTRLAVRAAPLGRLVLAGLEEAAALFRPDAVHAHGYLLATTFQIARLKARLGFRLLVDEHQLPHQSVPGRVHRLHRLGAAAAAHRWLLPLVDELVAVAEGARSWMIDEYMLPASRIHFIPLGADSELFKPDSAGGLALRRKLDISSDVAIVLSSGKIAPHKRLDLLVDAMAGLSRRTMLILVGPAEPAVVEELRARATRANVAMAVYPSVGPEELAQFFNLADICAWPADCTISHLEAASCAKPIIIPDEPGIRDRISAGNGLAARTGDVGALHEAIDNLLSDPDLRVRMGQAGRSMIVAHYSWAAIARSFEALYCGRELRRAG